MATARINDINIYYETYGEGIPLMLVAGLASDSQSWQPVVKDLSSRCKVIVFDNRGAGRTSPQETEISIQKMTDDCIGLARHLGIKSFDLLGHSMGGFVALDCAIRYPEYVNNLILAATSSFNSVRNNALFSDWAAWLDFGMDPKMWFRNIFYWIFSTRFFENKKAVQDAIRYAVEYPYPQKIAAFENQVKAIEKFKCTELLLKIKARTLVIAGKEDLLFSPDICSELAESILGAVISVIDNAAHAVHLDNPQAFTKEVLEFVFFDKKMNNL